MKKLNLCLLAVLLSQVACTAQRTVTVSREQALTSPQLERPKVTVVGTGGVPIVVDAIELRPNHEDQMAFLYPGDHLEALRETWKESPDWHDATLAVAVPSETTPITLYAGAGLGFLVGAGVASSLQTPGDCSGFTLYCQPKGPSMVSGGVVGSLVGAALAWAITSATDDRPPMALYNP